jgi:hypothetical protein
MLNEFVQQFEKLYGTDFMVYNVHLLNHIVKTARNFGPLFTTSLFVFESTNGVLNRFISGPKGPTIQICMRYFMYFTNFYNMTRVRISPVARDFCRKIMNKGSNEYKYTNVHKNWKIFKLPQYINNSFNECRLFKSFDKYYTRNMVISTIDQSNKNKMYCDSYIFYRNKFYLIKQILEEGDNLTQIFYILGRQINVKSFPWIKNYYEIVNYEPEILIKIDCLFNKCFYYELSNTKCINILRNSLLVD